MRGIDVGRHAASYVLVARILQNHLASGRLAQGRAVLLVLVAAPYVVFLIIYVGKEMDGVTVVHPCGIQAFAVVVYGHLSVDYLVASVAVHVGHAKVVVALPCISRVAGVVGIKHPLHFQVLPVPVIGGEHAARIIASGHDSRRTHAVEICHGGKETVGTVGIAVAPVLEIASRGI